jgi:Methylmalonic aciduria and homocystinuria type D protein
MSVHPPSPFIANNLERVLPDWNLSVLWVIIVLQQSRYELVEIRDEVEQEKERLREKFMRFGFDVAFNLRDRNYPSNLIDPRTGYPLLSRPGEIIHDDTAVVQALLGFPLLRNECRVLEHPHWGKAVYPSTLLTSAPPKIIKPVLKNIAADHGWKTQNQLINNFKIDQ